MTGKKDKAEETVKRLRDNVINVSRRHKKQHGRKKNKRNAAYIKKGWTSAILALVVQWHNYAQVMSAEHDLAADFQQRLHWGLMVPSTIFSTLSGTGGLGTLSFIGDTNSTSSSDATIQKGMTIATAILALLAAVFGAILMKLTPAAVAEGHRQKGKDYDLMVRRIQTELATPIGERDQGSVYAKELVGKYEELVDKAPHISKAKRLAPHNELDVADVLPDDDENDDTQQSVTPPDSDSQLGSNTTGAKTDRESPATHVERMHRKQELQDRATNLHKLQRKITKPDLYNKVKVTSTPIDTMEDVAKIKRMQREFAKRNKKESAERDYVLRRLQKNQKQTQLEATTTTAKK